MSFTDIVAEVADGILTVTLNRPTKLNALTGTMLQELLAVLDQADGDDAVRVVIVTGAGRAFCAGADLSRGGATFDRSARDRSPGDRSAEDRSAGDRLAGDQSAGDRASRGAAEPGEPGAGHRDGGGLFTLRVLDLAKPIIAAINGPAVGFGITMTLPMDIRLASTAARVGFVFARRGVVPEACSTWFLPRLVGISRAAEWVYTGRVFDAEEAWRGGLVSQVVPADDLLPAARRIAREIADNTSAVSVALARQLMWRMLGADHPMEAHRLDSRCMEFMGRSPDAHEGVTAFLEKRPARFSMRPGADMPPFYPWWPPRRFEP
ncbi:MAG TPA: crotonase/enoyl-CoA hydratase family protein [Candidatus Binatia bacterium]|nr:crotonase/enoyl-CoA hydratase family protein [Candidatus Binatia bacterium]